MRLATNFYPSPLAEVFATEAGLLPHERGYDSDEMDYYDDMEVKLIQFQQMSLVNKFEDCLVVYYGIELSEKRINFLKAIYQVTHQLLTGNRITAHLQTIYDQNNSTDKPDQKIILGALSSVIDLISKTPKCRRSA